LQPLDAAIEIINPADDGGFRLTDRQLLLDLIAAPLGLDGGIAKRGPGAVPEALTGVLLHGPAGVFGVSRE